MDKVQITYATTLSRFIRDIQADLNDYAQLRLVLQAQFDAALMHDTKQLGTVAEQILALVGVLDARLKQRRVFVAKLSAKAPHSIECVQALIPPKSRGAFISLWNNLESISTECKALNLRNCRLLTDQHEVMARVLQTEESLYASV